MAPQLIDVEPMTEPKSSSSSPAPEELLPKQKKVRAKGKPRTRQVKHDTSGTHRRSREGCYTCRVRRKKCDELTPTCTSCYNLHLRCEYEMPAWWKNADSRRRHKDSIKESIRSTRPINIPKLKSAPLVSPPPGPDEAAADTPPGLSHSIPTPNSISEGFSRPDQSSFATSPFSPPFQADTPQSFWDSTPAMPAQQWTPLPPQYPAFPTPQWELDIKTERQTYVNGFPSAKESTTSTFGTWEPITPTMMLPSYPPQSWTKQESYEIKTESFSEEPFDPNFFDFGNEPISPEHQVVVQVEDCDRPLLNHFLDNVAPFIFSVFDAKQKGSSLADVVLPQLENNPIYLHCCLSTSALHLKVTEHIEGEEIDTDIIRHRASTITSLCEAMSSESVDPSRLLEATLALILFQSSIGSPDDGLPDIPWHAHFQAVVSLVDRVQATTPQVDVRFGGHQAAFNMTLTYWIDILGATALRRGPLFSDVYRSQIELDRTSGLAELMGCDDRVMYLISEVACLDSLRDTMDMDHITLCQHVTNLGERLTYTEFGPAEMAVAYTPGSGAIRPRQLSRNITAIFRFAARIYLCSLVPGLDQHTQSIVDLVQKVADAMSFIPTGPDGFDRALVWPLLVAGSVAGPDTFFREMFHHRAKDLGQTAEFGSFGRVKELLDDVWRTNDDNIAKGDSLRVTWRDILTIKDLNYLII